MELQDKALNQAVKQFQAAYDNLMAQVRRVTDGPIDTVTPANLVNPNTSDEPGVPADAPEATSAAPIGWLHGDLQADALRAQAAQVKKADTEQCPPTDVLGMCVPFECDYVVVPATAEHAAVVKFFTRYNGFAQVAYGEELAATREARKAASEYTRLPQAGHLRHGDVNPFANQATSMPCVVILHPDAVKAQSSGTIEAFVDTGMVFGVFMDGSCSHLMGVSDTPRAKHALIESLEEKVKASAGSSWCLLETRAKVQAAFDLLTQPRIDAAVPCMVKRDHHAVYLTITHEEAIKLSAYKAA